MYNRAFSLSLLNYKIDYMCNNLSRYAESLKRVRARFCKSKSDAPRSLKQRKAFRATVSRFI